MKQIFITLLTLSTLSNLYGQTDTHGNPVFNSVQISEDKFPDFELTSSYYTIANNISNRKSSVYVSDNPSLTDYMQFSRDRPSYYFVVHQGENVMGMIILLQENENSKTTWTYNIVNPNNGQSMQAPCNVFGYITEKRADELLKLKIDTTSTIIDLPNNGKGLVFGDMAYRIQPYDELKAEVIEIAKQLTSPEEEIKEPEEYIKKESIGGKLDFNKVLETENQSLFLYDGIAYNKKDFAIFLWGKKVKTLGINSSKKATILWEEINKRELTAPERKALVAGFDSKEK